MSRLLDQLQATEDLKKLSVDQLHTLAEEIRDLITQTVSQTGGHLASNLGVVELTIALHRVFDFQRDRLLWDVGHQCYAHKILTGRKERFHTLRQYGGISGFPNPAESEYDVFCVGHAGTAIPTAIGMALGAAQTMNNQKIVAVVGDASIVNGLSFEGLNNIGLVKRQLLIVLNDNSMAIDVTQGAMASFLSRVRLSHTYEDIRNTTNRLLEHLPLIGKRMEETLDSIKKALRMAISPSRLFESLNIAYFGPVDGHDVGALIELFEGLAHLNAPAILHVYTKKGKGFRPADDNPRKYHSTGPFEINGLCELSPDKEGLTYTDAFGKCLVELAQKDSRIVAITAAMTDGTGLTAFSERFKSRFYDVGIAESAAVAIAAGMAKEGLKPVVCIYSTFLQRSFDQIFQEVSLQNLPVLFCLDRAGVVGSDGPTHHGLWDIGYLRLLPNMVIAAPADGWELSQMLSLAVSSSVPFAIRYPKEKVPCQPFCAQTPVEIGKSAIVRRGESEYVVIAFGAAVAQAASAAQMLWQEGIDITVINARFAKPLDPALLDWFKQGKTILTVEDHSIACGFGSALLEAGLQVVDKHKEGPFLSFLNRLQMLGAPDRYLPAGTRSQQLDWMGISAERIAQRIKDLKQGLYSDTKE